MRTTVEISDSLFAKVKRTMQERRTTLRALVEDGFRIAEIAHGRDHPLVGIQANDLADSLSKLGEYAEARRLQQRPRPRPTPGGHPRQRGGGGT